MEEDFSPFFAGLDVQKIIFVTPKGNREVTGYFDNTYVDSRLGETVLDTTAPRVTCILSDLAFLGEPSVFRGMPVIIKGRKYSAIKIDEEGTGLAIVALAHEEQT